MIVGKSHGFVNPPTRKPVCRGVTSSIRTSRSGDGPLWAFPSSLNSRTSAKGFGTAISTILWMEERTRAI